MTVVLRLDDGLLERLAGRPTDVKRPHRQLCARLPNRLRSNDPDRFAQFDELASGEIPSITHRANAPTAFAGEDRANLQLFHANPL